MARPTNKARVRRLLDNFGMSGEFERAPVVYAPLHAVQDAVGGAADSAVLELMQHGEIFLATLSEQGVLGHVSEVTPGDDDIPGFAVCRWTVR